MSRMKTFLIYLLLFIAFYVFSNIMINAFLKVSYTDILNYDVDVEELFVDITEAKASNRDGHIYGIVKNNRNEVIKDKYLKVSMLNNKGNVLGEKYVKIDEIQPEQLRKFEVNFNYKNVKTFKIEITDTKPEDINFLELIKTNANDWVNMVAN